MGKERTNWRRRTRLKLGSALFILFASALLPTAAAAPAVVPAYGDITFFVGSDHHYGCISGTNISADISRAALDRMNHLPGESYPTNWGGTVDKPRGVVVVGDMTDSGSGSQWRAFTNDWGLKGEKRLLFPLYEGFGNHDLRGSAVLPAFKARNAVRAGVTNISSNGYHYSWDWDFLHLVQLNVFPGNEVAAGSYGPDPRGSLAFLAEDLARCVGTSGRPIILFHHYGAETSGWSAQQKTNYFETIKNYNVLAAFSGHTHGARVATWRRFYTCTDGTCGRFTGNFFVVHVTRTNLVIVERRATNSWGASLRKNLPIFSPTLDSDRDGMPDWWEKHYGLNAADSRDAVRDPDRDGQSSMAEYVAGTDPTDGSDSFRTSPFSRSPSGDWTMAVSLAGYVGRAYTLERSPASNAQNWTIITNTPILDSNERLTLRDPSSGFEKSFYRVRLRLP